MMECPLFWGVVAQKPCIPHQNSRTKTLGCQLARKWFLSSETVLFELHVGNKHPTQNTASRGNFFCGLQNPYAEIWKLLTALAKIWSKSVQDKCLKGHTVLVTKNKTHFSVILHNPWVPPLLHEYALWSHTYIPGFIQICSGLGEL